MRSGQSERHAPTGPIKTRELSSCVSVLCGLDVVDDIVIASKNDEEHLQHLKEVFRLLGDYGLVANSDENSFSESRSK